MAGKSRTGNFFEDFRIGMLIAHPTPRTLTDGDRSLYIALTGSRDLLGSARTASEQAGLERQPLDGFLVFNLAFGKTVPDISLNAVANLGYADGRFLTPVHVGDTLRVESEIIGLRENSNGKSGVVYTRSTALNQHDQPVLTWVRWVMVRKRDPKAPAPAAEVPSLPAAVGADALAVPGYGPGVRKIAAMTGVSDFWEDYEAGERIDHPSAMTINDSDHSSATRLYQNTAKVHFDARMMAATPTGRRLVYGGHVISVARALAYDGLENVLGLLALNGGSHVAPTHAGDTVCCATTVVERIDLPHADVAALRLRTVAATGLDGAQQIVFPREGAGKDDAPGVVLDLDYTVAIPRKPKTTLSP
ncbi:MaoC family dehydratase [Variovorax defluvii]|uniref:MaoC family dehydratase n=1 Tax=Variovorax defluvii TaxID=913761 RepID=A0ABP8I8W3_9BURK